MYVQCYLVLVLVVRFFLPLSSTVWKYNCLLPREICRLMDMWANIIKLRIRNRWTEIFMLSSLILSFIRYTLVHANARALYKQAPLFYFRYCCRNYVWHKILCCMLVPIFPPIVHLSIERFLTQGAILLIILLRWIVIWGYCCTFTLSFLGLLRSSSNTKAGRHRNGNTIWISPGSNLCSFLHTNDGLLLGLFLSFFVTPLFVYTTFWNDNQWNNDWLVLKNVILRSLFTSFH